MPISSGSSYSLAWGCIVLISASVFSGPLLLLSVLLLCVSLTRTLDTGVRAHLGNPGLSHLEILNSITVVKALFPNKVILTSSGGSDVDIS